MSALTKIFVSLLIVCSLLMTAATVVFVNVNDSWKKAYDAQAARVERLEREKNAALDSMSSQKARADKAVDQLNTQVTSMTASIAGKIKELEAAQARVSEMKANNDVSQATIADLSTTMKAHQTALEDALARNKNLIKEVDDIRGKNFDLTGANTDLAKRLEQAESERKWLVEVNAQIKSDLDKAKNILISKGVSADEARPVVPLADINGVIKAVTNQNGQTYATITLGKAEHVAKGMRFTVINQVSKEFLGFFTVDTVDQNESFGRLEGPQVQAIQAGHKVLSQL